MRPVTTDKFWLSEAGGTAETARLGETSFSGRWISAGHGRGTRNQLKEARVISDLLYRLRAVVLRNRMERELDDELRFHIEHEAETAARTSPGTG